MQAVLSVAVDATLLTLTLALAAFGLAIIFGLVGVINLGHGAVLTIGAYVTWQAVTEGVPFFIAVIIAAVVAGVIGAVLELLVIRRFYDRPFETLLITWGFFLISTEVIKLVFGTRIRSVENPLPGAMRLGNLGVSQYRVVLALLALALISITAGIFYRTSFGLKVRAMIQNREMASLLAVHVTRMYRTVFILGFALAGLAGGLLTPITSIEPYVGNLWLVRSFFVVIVGGIGNILSGTLLGSFFIGGSETIFANFSEQIFAQSIVFALAVVLLRFRPTGLLAKGGS